MKKVSYMLFALLVVGAMVLAACTPAATPEPAPEPGDSMDLGGREVTIAIENAYLPFNYIDPETGEGAGWDYEVWDEICSILNCTPVYVEAAWEGMIQAVADGQFDAAADGITITADRAEIVDFSMGYVAIEQRLLVRADEDRIEGIQSIVDDAELKLGTQTGTTNYETALKHLDADRIEAFEQFPFAVQALLAGDIDAVIMDETAGQGYLGENADSLKLVGDSLSSDELGFIYPLGSDLVGPVDAALEEMMSNGFLVEVNAKYFGADFDVTYDDLFPPDEEEMDGIGSEANPIKVLFVPSVDVDFMIAGGDLIETALNEATGLYFEASVPTSYAATIEAMCASPTDTIGFIPAMGYALANQLCGVEPGLASARFGWNVYWAEFLVARDSDFQTLEDLEGATWAYPDAGSTSGFLYPSAIFDDLGITIGNTVEAGGHPQAVKAVYNGEADVATAYFSPPLLPEGRWALGDAPDIPDEFIPDCAVNEDDKLYCGEYRVLDARSAIREEAPDVMQKVRILTISGEIPNDTMSFSPDFPEDMKQTILDAVAAYVDSDACAETLCNENFYDWSGVGPIFDENFDGVRLLMEAQGITLENLGE
ncbi:MAG: transporter substrate-binding domain-containing protein [Anaerolineae bacterium]|jgi:phosphate/phosphite/phosphonate ABC transporter binding protein|nr:transporter substrate-binding domain-containing protein [Anaerolineae bacterium]MBT7069780.1 transporter substrate-binding domain-containing protein [Anaerolineae bacterium]MBT7324208.1 transporter substrate-binding domain-containing protein [Anaerolineae bacterium]